MGAPPLLPIRCSCSGCSLAIEGAEQVASAAPAAGTPEPPAPAAPEPVAPAAPDPPVTASPETPAPAKPPPPHLGERPPGNTKHHRLHDP